MTEDEDDNIMVYLSPPTAPQTLPNTLANLHDNFWFASHITNNLSSKDVENLYQTNSEFRDLVAENAQYIDDICTHEGLHGVVFRKYSEGLDTFIFMASYRDDKLNGPYFSFYNTSKFVKDDINDITNIILSAYKSYDGNFRNVMEYLHYNDLHVHEIGNYKYHKKDGIWAAYYPSSLKSSLCTYKDDKKHGEYNSWFDNSRWHENGYYKNDVKVGIWKEWDYNGKLIQSEDYGIGRGDISQCTLQ